MARIIDGKAVAAQVRGELRPRLEALRRRRVVPGLAAVLVGDNPASQVYIRNKRKACEEMGMASEVFRLPVSTPEAELLSLVDKLNRDGSFHGVLVQLPLPPHIREERVIEAVDPAKDVDCFHPENVGRLLLGRPRFAPATPAGVVELLLRSGLDPAGRHVVILGRSNIVGKPLAALLVQKRHGGNATVTLCHTATQDLARHTHAADIIVAAMGQPEFLRGSMVSDGVVVVDVGINPKAGGGLVGDVAFEEVAPKAKAITPVPGGVGPMTIAMLLQNTVASAEAAPEPK